MSDSLSVNRRVFLQGLTAAAVGEAVAGSSATEVAFAEDAAAKAVAAGSVSLRPNMVGAYGPWLAETVLGDGPAALSFRNGRWKDVEQWRTAARKRGSTTRLSGARIAPRLNPR